MEKSGRTVSTYGLWWQWFSLDRKLLYLLNHTPVPTKFDSISWRKQWEKSLLRRKGIWVSFKNGYQRKIWLKEEWVMLQTIKRIFRDSSGTCPCGRRKPTAASVAAYCHVSTLQEQQESSYESQVNHYREKIQNHPGWKLAGIYADDGKSATSTKNVWIFRQWSRVVWRKIDMVLTKSISRFARNTVDALTNIENWRKNISVIFEKEGIMEGSGELLLTILSSQAQEESRNISETVIGVLCAEVWGRESHGEPQQISGLLKDKDGNLVIVPEEARWCGGSINCIWKATAATASNGFWKLRAFLQ